MFSLSTINPTNFECSFFRELNGMESVSLSTSLNSLNQTPQKPLPTYLWEDIRRSKTRGGYPWTYLYKRSISKSNMDSDSVTGVVNVNGTDNDKRFKKDPCFIIPVDHVDDFKENFSANRNSNLVSQKSSSNSENCIPKKSNLKKRRSSTDSGNRHKKHHNFMEKLSTKFPRFKSNSMRKKAPDACIKPASNHVLNNNSKRKECSASVIFVPLRSYDDGYLGESQENFDDLEMLKASPLSQKKVTFNKDTDADNDNTVKFQTITKWKKPEQDVSEHVYESIYHPDLNNNNVPTAIDNKNLDKVTDENNNSCDTLKNDQSQSDLTLTLTDIKSTSNNNDETAPPKPNRSLFNNKQLRSSFRNQAQKLKLKANQIQTKIRNNCPKNIQCPKLRFPEVKSNIHQLNTYPKSIIRRLKNMHADDPKPIAAVRKKRSKSHTQSLNDLQFEKCATKAAKQLENRVPQKKTYSTTDLVTTKVDHKQGVLEEIDGDEFFLRQKGISRDNINERDYLSLEIKDAFRNPINSLGQIERKIGEVARPVPTGNRQAPYASEESIHDYSNEYPLMRHNGVSSNQNDELSFQSIDVHSVESKLPKVPKRKSKSLRQLHFRSSTNTLTEPIKVNDESSLPSTPVAPKRTRSRLQVNSVKKTMCADVQPPITLRFHGTNRMHNTIRFLHTVPRSTLSLSVPERPKRTIKSKRIVRRNLKAASYAEIGTCVQSRPLPAPPRPPRKSRESIMFMDEDTVCCQKESRVLSSCRLPPDSHREDVADDKEFNHGSLILSNENSITDTKSLHNNNNDDDRSRLMEQKKEQEVLYHAKPSTSRSPVAIDKLQVRCLDVDRLTISEIRADKLTIVDPSANNLHTSNLESQTGQLQLSQIEFSQEVIKEIVRLLAHSFSQARNSVSGNTTDSSHGNGLNRMSSSGGDGSSKETSETVSPNRSEQLLFPNAHIRHFMRTLNSIEVSNDFHIQRPRQPESCLVDALSTIVNLSLELSKEIFSIFGTIIHQSALSHNIPLLTVGMVVALLALVMTHFHGTSDDPIIHHQWQYYNPPGNF